MILKGSLHTASFVLGYQATMTQIKTTRCMMTGIIWKSLEIMLKERWKGMDQSRKELLESLVDIAMSKWIYPRPSMSGSNLTSSRSGTHICSEWGISLCGFPMRIHRQRSMTALQISLPVYDMERVTGCLCGWEAGVLLDSML